MFGVNEQNRAGRCVVGGLRENRVIMVANATRAASELGGPNVVAIRASIKAAYLPRLIYVWHSTTGPK